MHRSARIRRRSRRSRRFKTKRCASISKPNVSIDAGMATMATEKIAVKAQSDLSNVVSSPSGSPCPVSMRIDRYIVAGMDSKPSAPAPE